MNSDSNLKQITKILHSFADRTTKAQQIAEVIRQAGSYRWVGIYDVDDQEIAIVAWSGISAPAYPRFPVTQGLSGHAVATHSTVVSNDVTNDLRYLMAFGNTQSEIIVPIIATKCQLVIGTLNVESEQKDAFTAVDQRKLEAYAEAMVGLWQ